MERLQRLSEFWNWLPAFRAVAETSHLPTASKQFGVSASALSRAIHLLENDLGRKLFHRYGRRLQLNQTGEQFLASVRDAMRLIDEGLGAVTSQDPSGPVHVSTTGLLTEVVIPILIELHKSYPDVVFHQHHHPTSGINSLLTQGQLDVAFLADPVPHKGLHIEELGCSTNGIYCGRGHALHRARKVTLDRILEYPFATPASRPGGAVGMDGWPVSLKRRVGMQLTRLNAAVETCSSGHLLAVLPDYVAATHAQSGALRRLPIDIIPTTTFYAIRRETVVIGGVAERVIEDVKRRFVALLERSSKGRTGRV